MKRVTSVIVTLVCVMLPQFLCNPARASEIPASVIVQNPTIKINLSSSFAGLSYGKNSLSTGLFTGVNTPFINICKRLGPTLLRFAADDTGATHWVANGKGKTIGQVSMIDINNLAAFLRATNWKVLYSINLGTNTVSSAVSEAVYVSQTLGSHLYGFEIGNEPENFAALGVRPVTYDFTAYKADWEPYAKAIRAQLPNAVLTGTASANLRFINPFPAAESSLASLLTLHYYRGRGIDSPTSNLGELMAPNPTLSSRLATVRADASTMSRGYRVAECNSFSDGGVAGASDTFGSALWAIDFLFQIAQAQTTGANFHGGGDLATGYTPIADDNHGNVVSVRPIFYGIQLFSMAAQGTLMNTQVTGPTTTFNAYAVGQQNNEAVVLNNKDTVNSVSATVVLNTTFHKATTFLLTAPSVESTGGVTLGGAPMYSDGSWVPWPLTIYPQGNHQVTVIVPPGSAMLIQTDNVN